MTCLEKYKQDHPDMPMTIFGTPLACPHTHGYKARPEWCLGVPMAGDCSRCWNRQLPERTNTGKQPIPPTVLYRCDRRACETCSFPDCQHTPDITHAVDFHKDIDGTYVED